MTKLLTIKQVAERVGLSAHTLRYYERIGLIDPIAKQNNHRVYSEMDIEWIDFLLKIKSTGMPIKQMLRYAQLRRLGNSQESVSERKAILEKHADNVEKALLELQVNHKILQSKIALYETIEAQLGTEQETI